jgi:hypothetical protein
MDEIEVPGRRFDMSPMFSLFMFQEDKVDFKLQNTEH